MHFSTIKGTKKYEDIVPFIMLNIQHPHIKSEEGVLKF